MKIITQLIILLYIQIAPMVLAEAIQSNYKGLILNAHFQNSDDKKQPTFLLVHGTWATHNMEIQSYLQSLLTEEGYASLAITLSLGIDDRVSQPDCNKTITAGQNDNLDEITHWLNYLQDLGFSNIVIIGHSRGGAQVASFNQLVKDDRIKAQVLIAPMVFHEQAVPEAAVKLATTSKQPILGPVRVIYCEQAKVTLNAYKSYYLSSPEKNTPTLIKDTILPTLIYLGSDDKLITEKFVNQSRIYEANSKISVKIIDGADHFFRDLYADEIIEHLLENMQ